MHEIGVRGLSAAAFCLVPADCEVPPKTAHAEGSAGTAAEPSPGQGPIAPSMAAALADGARGSDPAGRRAEFVQLADLTRALSGEKPAP
jgi:hypothetical protein